MENLMKPIDTRPS